MWYGPYSYVPNDIPKFPGVYLLGSGGAWRYVGRSDHDLSARIPDHAGEAYDSVAFTCTASAKGAYELERKLWHEQGGDRGLLRNLLHPAKPFGANWPCQVCWR